MNEDIRWCRPNVTEHFDACRRSTPRSPGTLLKSTRVPNTRAARRKYLATFRETAFNICADDTKARDAKATAGVEVSDVIGVHPGGGGEGPGHWGRDNPG